MDNHEKPDRIPFPNKIIGYWDIARGLGELALDVVIHRHRDSEEQYFTDAVAPERYDTFDLTPVQKDANAWVDKIGHGYD